MASRTDILRSGPTTHSAPVNQGATVEPLGWEWKPNIDLDLEWVFEGRPGDRPPPDRPDRPPIQPPEGGQPPGGGTEPPTQGAVLLFEETFQDGKLDQSKWFTRYIYGGPDGPGTCDFLNDEVQRFRESGNHVFSNEGLGLTANRGWDPNDGSGVPEIYPSGMIRSKALFDLANGDDYFFECRARVPRGQGVWPAFWLINDLRDPNDPGTAFWPPEIDIMEIVNNGVEDTTTMLGCRCQVNDWNANHQRYSLEGVDPAFNAQHSTWNAPFDFADDFHLFGLHFRNPDLAFYCDRGLLARGTYHWVNDDDRPSAPAHILLNLAIGGGWAGRHGIDNSAFPNVLQVTRISVWSNKAQNLGTGTCGKDYELDSAAATAAAKGPAPAAAQGRGHQGGHQGGPRRDR